MNIRFLLATSIAFLTVEASAQSQGVGFFGGLGQQVATAAGVAPAPQAAPPKPQAPVAPAPAPAQPQVVGDTTPQVPTTSNNGVQLFIDANTDEINGDPLSIIELYNKVSQISTTLNSKRKGGSQTVSDGSAVYSPSKAFNGQQNKKDRTEDFISPQAIKEGMAPRLTAHTTEIPNDNGQRVFKIEVKDETGKVIDSQFIYPQSSVAVNGGTNNGQTTSNTPNQPGFNSVGGTPALTNNQNNFGNQGSQQAPQQIRVSPNISPETQAAADRLIANARSNLSLVRGAR